MGELLEEPKHTGEGEEHTPDRAVSSLLEATKTIEKPSGIRPGDTVTIQFAGETDTETVRIVDRRDPEYPRSAATEVSLSSPLGAKIIGAKAGDTVTYSASGNRTESVTVIEINPAPSVEPSEASEP